MHRKLNAWKIFCGLFLLSVVSLSLHLISSAEDKPAQAAPAASLQPTPTTAPTETPAATPAPVQAEDNQKADFVGASACLACHANQQSFSSSVHGHGFAKLKGIDAEKSCETCHGPGSLHAAAAGDKSNPGFATIKNMKGNVASSCLQCHQDQKRLHWAGGTHEKRGVSCTTCHSVHAAKTEKGLLVEKDEKSVCFKCHQDIKAQVKRQSHMPIMEGKLSCQDCHNPHGSGNAKQINSDSVTQLCTSCHAEKRGPMLWEHPPVRENCLTCHTAHGSHHDKMLNAKMPYLCQRCHNDSRHPSTAYSATEVAARDPRVTSNSCVNCHSNIHGSNHPSGRYFQR